MNRSLLTVLLSSGILGFVGCSKEEPEGTAEQMGKKTATCNSEENGL
jgi:hypothetical protein